MTASNFRTRDLKNLMNSPDTLFFVALSYLATRDDLIVPELLYTLDKEEILKLISVFGGEEIKIPSPQELRKALRCSLFSYYRIVQKRKWRWIQEHMDIPQEEMSYYKDEHFKWLTRANQEEVDLLRKLKEYGEIEV